MTFRRTTDGPSGKMPCGKIGYLTRKEAKSAANALPQHGKLRVYHCTDERCDGLPWHLTSGQRAGLAR